MIALLLTSSREGTLVMMATLFLVGGLVFPPVWLLVRFGQIVCVPAFILTVDIVDLLVHQKIKKRVPVCVLRSLFWLRIPGSKSHYCRNVLTAFQLCNRSLNL
jgi:hypothetical protein